MRISQAVGMGFLIMGVIGYVVKLSESTRFQRCCSVECDSRLTGGCSTHPGKQHLGWRRISGDRPRKQRSLGDAMAYELCARRLGFRKEQHSEEFGSVLRSTRTGVVASVLYDVNAEPTSTCAIPGRK